MADLDDIEQLREIEELRAKPTVGKWRTELLRIISGDREFAVIRIGSVQEYVENQLAASQDRVIARTCFLDGLDLVIQGWQPTRPESDHSISHILDLLGAYSPQQGLVKLLGFMERWGRLNRSFVTPVGFRRDLHKRALNVLATYYPVAPQPPASHEPPFLNYKNLLYRHLSDVDYSVYAVVRLLELELLKTQGAEIGELIQKAPGSLTKLVAVFVQPRWRFRAGRDIGGLFEHCLWQKSLDLFRQALKDSNAELIHGTQQPQIQLSDGNQVELPLDTDALDEYMEYMLVVRMPDSKSVFDALDSKLHG